MFDEAQRAWDVDQVERKHNIKKSEPDLLIGIGEKVPDWSVLVGLVGGGQEIHTGEEAGIVQWVDAISPPNATEAWKVWCAEKLPRPSTATTSPATTASTSPCRCDHDVRRTPPTCATCGGAARATAERLA